MDSNKERQVVSESPKILHLTLKKKWFDMIASGEKKEEYREIKPYWIKRLCMDNWPYLIDDLKKKVTPELNDETVFDILQRDFDCIQFRNGYSKNAPTLTVKCEGIAIDLGMLTWGAEKDTEYFVIKLGEIIN
jgi:hypothetical protein